MFCQACGNEQTAELSYCNRCGARFGLGKELQVRSSAKLTASVVALSASMTIITLGGFFGVLICAMELLQRDLRLPDGFVFLLVFILVVVMGFDVLLARQLGRLLSSGSRFTEVVPPVQTPVISGRSMPQLSEKRSAVSVTENTTRFFEPSWESRDTQSNL